MLQVLLADPLYWHIPLFGTFLIATLLYLYIAKKKYVASGMKIGLFLTGIWLLYFAIGSPLLVISYLSLSFHMIQMSFLYFIIPPFLLLGIPQDVIKKMPVNCHIRWRFPSKLALLLFALLFLCYHLPFLLEVLLQHRFLQTTYLIILFMLSFVMWLPLATPIVMERYEAKKKKRFLFLSSLWMMPACMLFIVGGLLEQVNHPLLQQWTTHLCIPKNDALHLLGLPISAKYDQMLAGTFMLLLHKVGLVTTDKLAPKCK